MGSRDFTINLSRQCRAFSRALKTEKLKAPLFPGHVGAGTTKDWCIIQIRTFNLQSGTEYHRYLRFYQFL